MSYTKGEWKDKLSATGERIIYVETEGGIEVICRDIRHFNAPIVKAAPDMYKSLSEMVKWFGRYPTWIPNPEIQEQMMASINGASMALAKAEGRNS